MEILKKGNTNKRYKLTCNKCGCEFVLDSIEIPGGASGISCPCCRNLVNLNTKVEYKTKRVLDLTEEEANKICDNHCLECGQKCPLWLKGDTCIKTIIDNKETNRFDTEVDLDKEGLN